MGSTTVIAGIAIEVIAGAATYDPVIIGEAVVPVIGAACDMVVAGREDVEEPAATAMSGYG